MKKIKFLSMALMAMMCAGTFSACGDDDPKEIIKEVEVIKEVEKIVEVPADNAFTRYQNAVTENVKKSKSHDKAILLVAFGSTWEQAYNAFDDAVAAYKAEFPEYDVFLSFSSAICINRAAAGENVASRNFYAPNYWLTAFAQEGVKYSEIVVQSLQVIPGEEYTRVINYIKDFANNSNGDLDDDYLANVTLKLGVPLLQDADVDVPAVAKELNTIYSEIAKDNYILFMGHGNPDSYDTYKANVRYTQLEEALQALNPHYFVGTVDMMDNFKTDVYERMQAKGFKSGTVYCHPLMSIDGDHGHNDMAGDDIQEGATKFSDLEANEEGEVEDTSWKVYFSLAGYTCNDETMIEKGLLELPTVRAVWMQHTTDAIAGEPLDYYHSKNPE
ncbi:MAG: sirohydrochlorin cobaltochelatase [Bacteroidaceae bacterium]|nr:sirohydrochlorin cobaltochelatase [Bacteroidaceae bacterium]MBQ9884868.1 sirohydrochlorin cobaltochelatase [Bacteroidaceae bacterium]